MFGIYGFMDFLWTFGKIYPDITPPYLVQKEGRGFLGCFDLCEALKSHKKISVAKADLIPGLIGRVGAEVGKLLKTEVLADWNEVDGLYTLYVKDRY